MDIALVRRLLEFFIGLSSDDSLLSQYRAERDRAVLELFEKLVSEGDGTYEFILKYVLNRSSLSIEINDQKFAKVTIKPGPLVSKFAVNVFREAFSRQGRWSLPFLVQIDDSQLEGDWGVECLKQTFGSFV